MQHLEQWANLNLALGYRNIIQHWLVSSQIIQKWQITERVIRFHVKRICPELLMVALLNSFPLHDPPTEGCGCCKRWREVGFSGLGQKIFIRNRNICGYDLIWRDRDDQGIIVVTSRCRRTKHLFVIRGCTGCFLLKPFWLIPTIEIVMLCCGWKCEVYVGLFDHQGR